MIQHIIIAGHMARCFLGYYSGITNACAICELCIDSFVSSNLLRDGPYGKSTLVVRFPRANKYLIFLRRKYS